MTARPPPITPCIGVCTLSEDRSHCLGCGRTLRDIAAWSGYDDATRQRIVDALQRAKTPPQQGERSR